MEKKKEIEEQKSMQNPKPQVQKKMSHYDSTEHTN